MKIQEVEIRIVRANIDDVNARIIGKKIQIDELLMRNAVIEALKRASETGAQALAFPISEYDAKNLPLVGAGKIMIQEIIKYLKNLKTGLKEIIFCVSDDGSFKIFNDAVLSYVEHIQKTLGLGPYVTVDIIIECSVKLLKQFAETSAEFVNFAGKGGVILIERSNPPYGWALPGGFVDYGESLEGAAIREAKEETNLDLIDLRQFHTYSEPGRDPRFHTISTVFVAEGRGAPQFGDDAKGLKIVRYEDLPELEYAFDHKDIIKEYLIEKDFD